MLYSAASFKHIFFHKIVHCILHECCLVIYFFVCYLFISSVFKADHGVYLSLFILHFTDIDIR
jgi:hypothetical protein